jgi:hypothetical protein
MGSKPRIRASNLHTVMHRKAQHPTDMGIAEALTIVLEVARNQEYDDIGDFDFNWTADHTEACGVVDELLLNAINIEEGVE